MISPSPNPGPATRRFVRAALAAAACSLAAGFSAAGSGCAKPLLSPSDERTPFDRYDAVREQYAPQYVEDKFGRRQPNLRGRLEPKN